MDIKIGQSSHKMYSNNIVNFQESTTILNACTKKVWKLIECTTYFGFRLESVDEFTEIVPSSFGTLLAIIRGCLQVYT